MYKNKLSNYKNDYSWSPSQLNLINLWHYKQIERVKEDQHIATKINHILSHMESLGIEIPRSNNPKPKKSHSDQKAQ